MTTVYTAAQRSHIVGANREYSQIFLLHSFATFLPVQGGSFRGSGGHGGWNRFVWGHTREGGGDEPSGGCGPYLSAV